MKAKIHKKDKVLHHELSYEINGVLFQARKELGMFCNEQQYCDCIENRLKDRKISYEREKILSPSFDGELRGRNKVDFVIENKVLIEVKAKPYLTPKDFYQVQRYLKSSGLELAILINMRRYSITPKRILNLSMYKK